jgi:diguanylate cyclase (GGDEF)-like protein
VGRVRAMGYAVKVCAGGEEELASLLERRCDLILVDLALGRERAVAICRSIRSHTHGRQATVLAVTDGCSENGLVSVVETGADDFVLDSDDEARLHMRFAVAEHRRAEKSRWREAALEAEGHPASTVMTYPDISERHLYDPVTGLPNRALLLDRLHQALEMSRRPGGRSFAAIALELDRFSHVSSSYGPTAADRFLTSVASRLKEGLRSSDTVTAPSPTLAHVDGGRFTILLHDVSDPRDAVRVARRLQATLQVPFSIEGDEVFSSASLGLVAGMSGYHAATEILRDAEAALSQARAAGGGATVVFDPEMHASTVAMLKLENELHHAIERRELRVHYQPLLALEDGSLVGFEALLRWQHPEGRLFQPEEFIPLAEQTGLVVPIDRWVIDTVCRQIRAWRGRFGKKLPLVISANVSGRQFTQPDFTVAIDRSLRAHGLYGGAIKLEITESVIMEQAEFAAEMLSQLHDLDIKLSIDDFGTGYSSFSYLRRFEIDTLKIDRSFVGRMDIDQESAEIVRAIVGLGRSLGKNVVAEGVENCNQVLMLRDLGCPYAQGFYFAPGLAPDEATNLIARQHIGDLFTV